MSGNQNTWSAKTALTDQEKDCFANIQSFFTKRQAPAPDAQIKEIGKMNSESGVKK